jgi:Ca-activated chloride channel homolog
MRRVLRDPLRLIAGAMLLALVMVSLRVGWLAPWVPADRQGSWLMLHGRYAEAAAVFADPMWRGIALVKAGSFDDAATEFAGIDTAEAAYDQGNALVMLGKYDDAVGRYDRALALRPDWNNAAANREIARLRAARLKTTGGVPAGGDEDTPDAVVFEKGHKPTTGEKDQAPGDGEMSDEAIRALWLARVHTQPADFLRARFLSQLQPHSP